MAKDLAELRPSVVEGRALERGSRVFSGDSSLSVEGAAWFLLMLGVKREKREKSKKKLVNKKEPEVEVWRILCVAK